NGANFAQFVQWLEKLRTYYTSFFGPLTRGLIYLKLGEWDLAITDYDSALRLDPKLASALYGRGVAKLKKGETSEGDADLAAARKLEANIVADFVRYGVQ